MRRLLLIWIILGRVGAEPALAASIAPGEESHPGLALESMYSEAVLAFNKKQTKEAVTLLNELLTRDPNHVQALELKALSLKSQGDDVLSMEVYQRLLKLKPAVERAPYHFELGVIYHRQKRPEFAKLHFEKAVQRQFNLAPSHLFLGLINFNSDSLGPAAKNFSAVTEGNIPDLKVVAHYYLGLIHFKNGFGAGGTHEMLTARDLALEFPDNPMAVDIRNSTEKILAPFNSATWFGSLSALSQYDSNVASLPVALAATTPASGKSTIKASLTGGAGRMSSPLKAFQWVASYRFAANRNLNSNARSYEYVTNLPSFYLNYLPLNETTGGLKVDGSLVFQNLPKDETDPTGAYSFYKYSLGAEIGPFIRHHFGRALQLEASFAARPQTVFTDSELSGTALMAKTLTRLDLDSSLLSPTLNVSYEINNANGADYRSRTLGFGFSNVTRVGAEHALNLSVDYLLSSYPQEASLRADRNLSARVSFVYLLKLKWSLALDAGYVSNVSSLPDSYSYNRFTAGLGMNWSL